MIPITKAVFDESDMKIIQEPLKSGWVVQELTATECFEPDISENKSSNCFTYFPCTTQPLFNGSVGS